MVARHCLSYHNYETSEACNGLEAIAMLKQQRFDVVLMDLHMPEMDGIGATTAIRNELKLDVPIIALTANAFQAEIDKCLSAGMNSYVTKPFDEKVLIDQINRTIKMSRATITPPSISGQPNQTLQKLYSLAKLEQLSHGDQRFVKSILTIFATDMPVMLSQLQRGVDMNDASTIRSISHKMKPAIDNLGIDMLYDTVRSLEKTDQVHPNTVALYDHLAAVLDEVLGDIRKTALA